MPSLDTLPAEIISRICNVSYFRVESCLSIALTCRHTNIPALKHLWSDLMSFAQLIYTLPQNAWKYNTSKVNLYGRDGTLFTFYLTRDLTPNDLVRFRLYASFVERYDDAWAFARKRLYLDTTVWDALERFLPSCAMPNLRSISYNGFHKDVIPKIEPLHIFFGPRLRRLYMGEFEGHGKDPDDVKQNIAMLLRILAEAPNRAPQLKDLTLSPYPSDPEMKQAINDLVIRLPGLDTFSSTHPIEPQAYRHLASFDNLRELVVQILSKDYPLLEALSPPYHSFPSLHKLSVRSDSITHICALLLGIQSTELRNVAVQTLEPVSHVELTHLTSVLGRHPSAVNIVKLGFDFGHGRSPDPAKPLLPSAFEALYSLRSLERLILLGGSYPLLDDEAMLGMARAWPELMSLMLHSHLDGSRTYDTHVTLEGIGAFALHCSYLRDLHVAIDDIDEDAIEAAQSIEVRSRPFRRHMWDFEFDLSIGRPYFEFEDAARIAAILSGWFPTLERVHTAWNIREGLDEEEAEEVLLMVVEWRQLSRLLAAFGKLRKKERLWGWRTISGQAAMDSWV